MKQEHKIIFYQITKTNKKTSVFFFGEWDSIPVECGSYESIENAYRKIKKLKNFDKECYSFKNILEMWK